MRLGKFSMIHTHTHTPHTPHRTIGKAFSPTETIHQSVVKQASDQVGEFVEDGGIIPTIH